MRRIIISACVINLSLINCGIIFDFVATCAYNSSSDDSPLTIICVTFGFACAAVITDYLGRRSALIVANVSLVINWILLRFCKNRTQNNLEIGFLYFNCCLLSLPVVIYVSEIARPTIRGRLLASSLLYVSAGSIVEESCKLLFTVRESMLINCIVPFVSLASLFFVPESPYWLIDKEKMDRTRDSLRWYLNDDQDGTATTCIEIDMKCLCKEMGKTLDLWIEQQPDKSPAVVDKRFVRRLFGKRFVEAAWTIGFLSFAYQFAGSPTAAHALIAYVQTETRNNASAVAVYESLQIVGTCVSVLNQRYLGRRLLTMTTVALLVVIDVLTAIYFYAKAHHQRANVAANVFDGWTVAGCVLALSVTFVVNCGLRALPWILCGELFDYRSKCYGTAVVGTVTYAFHRIYALVLVDSGVVVDRPIGCSLMFAFVAFLCVLHVKTNVTETEGKTLYNVQKAIVGNRRKIDKRTNGQLRSFDANEMNDSCYYI